jgi:hypothetical protein
MTDRDYESLLPRVLVAMYPEEDTRRDVVNRLSVYGSETWHAGRARVHMGILKLAWSQPGKLDEFVQLACQDYRDLLCAAEYPLSSRDYRLKEQDPEKYRLYQEEERARYDAWLAQLLLAN